MNRLGGSGSGRTRPTVGLLLRAAAFLCSFGCWATVGCGKDRVQAPRNNGESALASPPARGLPDEPRVASPMAPTQVQLVRAALQSRPTATALATVPSPRLQKPQVDRIGIRFAAILAGDPEFAAGLHGVNDNVGRRLAGVLARLCDEEGVTVGDFAASFEAFYGESRGAIHIWDNTSSGARIDGTDGAGG